MQNKKYAILIVTACLMATGVQKVQAETNTNTPLYVLQTPSLEGRLDYSEDGKTAVLFAPGVSRESGWYDTNKYWDGKDGRLCWAASCSNLIAWYLDRCEESGEIDLSSYDRNKEQIFEHFRDNWDPLEGYDPMNGFAWYFTGQTTDGKKPPELLYENSGGYLQFLPHCNEPWSIIDPVHKYSVIGNYQDKYPFVDDEIGFYYPGDPLYSHESFSDTIKEQLTYGASVINVGQEGATATGGHAITLWGCEYSTETGLISKIYVTDSDDEDRYPGSCLKELGIRARVPDQEGIQITGYYLSGSGSPLTKFTSSTLLYSYGVVEHETEEPEQKPENLSGVLNINLMTPKPGDLLTASLTGFQPSGKLTYVWKSDEKILGTGADYRVTEQDKGSRIYCVVTSDIESGSVVSAFTEAVEDPYGDAAALLDKKIAEIGNVDLSKEQQIREIRKIYEEASSEVKERVTGIEVLKAAEAEIERLKADRTEVWIQEGDHWFYIKKNKKYAESEFLKIGKNTFYFNENGHMETGWKAIDRKWYYFYDSGRMLTGWQKIEGFWYYLKPTGEMAKGWQKLGVHWFYFNGSGHMVTGWQKLGVNWFYFYPSGAMAADRVINGYYVNKSGAWVR